MLKACPRSSGPAALLGAGPSRQQDMVHRIAPAACQHVLQSRLSLQMFQQMMVHKQQLPNILWSLRSCSQKGDCLQYCPQLPAQALLTFGEPEKTEPGPLCFDATQVDSILKHQTCRPYR